MGSMNTIVTSLLLVLPVIEDSEIVYRDYIDISCAVATPKVIDHN